MCLNLVGPVALLSVTERRGRGLETLEAYLDTGMTGMNLLSLAGTGGGTGDFSGGGITLGFVSRIGCAAGIWSARLRSVFGELPRSVCALGARGVVLDPVELANISTAAMVSSNIFESSVSVSSCVLVPFGTPSLVCFACEAF